MNDNANITFKLTESKQALSTILSIQPRDSGAVKAPEGDKSAQAPKTPDQTVDELCDILAAQLPPIIKEPAQDAPKLQKQDLRKSVAPVKAI
jgi:dynein heavy chain